MSKWIEVVDSTQLVEGPPVKVFVRDSGGVITEPCVLVGHFVMEEEHRPYLDELGVNTSWASYNRKTGRWERCLMSEAVADMLQEMNAGGSFPYSFEAGPSEGEVAWIKAQATGATERPELPLSSYLAPATAEVLDELAALAGGEGTPLKRRGWTNEA